MNSYYDLEVEHGAELLTTPAALGTWLSSHRLITRTTTADRRDLKRALAARAGLRALAAAGADRRASAEALQSLNDPAHGAALEVRFGEQRPHFIPAPGTGATGAIGTLLAIAAQAMLDGTWARLKLCPGPECGWTFYDYSRNQAGKWCSMSVCGGREKARAHYRRSRSRS
jgi:predicted RNA-binding Zn ribbon-like protein